MNVLGTRRAEFRGGIAGFSKTCLQQSGASSNFRERYATRFRAQRFVEVQIPTAVRLIGIRADRDRPDGDRGYLSQSGNYPFVKLAELRSSVGRNLGVRKSTQFRTPSPHSSNRCKLLSRISACRRVFRTPVRGFEFAAQDHSLPLPDGANPLTRRRWPSLPTRPCRSAANRSCGNTLVSMSFCKKRPISVHSESMAYRSIAKHLPPQAGIRN